MGEEKETQKKRGEGKEKEGGAEKQEEEAVEVKLDMHCEGCAHKVRKAVRSLRGVEAVAVDPASNKLKAIGAVDPWKLKEFLEAKTKKKVDFVFPKDPPKKPKEDGGKKTTAAAEEENGQKKSSSDDRNKPKPPMSSTVVLKIPLHCDGCIQRIKRNAYRIRGVEEVTVEPAKDIVTVTGTMDAKTLPAALEDRLKRRVELVPAKKEKVGDGGKKENEGGGGGEKEDKEGAKKEETKTTAAAAAVAAEANKAMDYYYAYRIEMAHAPQLFSDENPNACTVM